MSQEEGLQSSLVTPDTSSPAMQQSVFTQVLSLNDRVKEQAKLANEKRLIVVQKKQKLEQYMAELANMQKVMGDFNKKWFADFGGSASLGYDGLQFVLEKEIEWAQKDYEAQTENTHLLVTQKNQNAADAYIAKKQELESLEIEQKNLEQKIAAKKLVVQKCSQIACETNPLLLYPQK